MSDTTSPARGKIAWQSKLATVALGFLISAAILNDARLSIPTFVILLALKFAPRIKPDERLFFS